MVAQSKLKSADAVDKQMTRIRAVVISKPYHRKFLKVQKIVIHNAKYCYIFEALPSKFLKVYS